MNALTPITPEPVLSAVLRYAARGIPVFPVKRDKRPFSNRELRLPDDQPGGFHVATTDPGKITEWWRRQPNAGIGMPTGASSGTLVLDIDGEKGERTLTRLEARHGALPRTRSQRTGGGGRQLFFLWQGERIRNLARDIGPGLDTRGVKEDGSPAGYGVLPPSPHLSGGTYRWETRTPAVPRRPRGRRGVRRDCARCGRGEAEAGAAPQWPGLEVNWRKALDEKEPAARSARGRV
jgi:Bifunctional DNA primase/polymerase, N-terminal